MFVRDFDFDLPADLIAQEPAPERGASRLIVIRRDDELTAEPAHHLVSELPALLRAGDLLVVNNTKVFPARLLGRRLPGGGAVECLLVARLPDESERLDPESSERWEALVHPGQRLAPGRRMLFDGQPALHGEILEQHFHGRRIVRLWTDDGSPVDRAVDMIGHVPLPPYIRRPDAVADRDRYQTIFARQRGSIAAPTAGLHLTDAMVAELGERDVSVVEITLHVGYGTFQPVRVERVEDHRLEAERFEIAESAAASINRALDERRRVIAVGTTTTRTLEAVAVSNAGRIAPGAGATDLFIHPGFSFQVVSGLLTNFHLPKSSLLMLVAAFAGRERVLQAYAAAIDARYRFYSYGDAMLVL